jgi:hypothetical protein
MIVQSLQLLQPKIHQQPAVCSNRHPDHLLLLTLILLQ